VAGTSTSIGFGSDSWQAGRPRTIVAVAAVSHPRLDGAEFSALQVETGWQLGVELIAGEAVVIPPAGGHAASVQGELFFALRAWKERSADGGLLLQDVFVHLGEDSFLAPDIAYWSADRRPPLARGALEVAPDLVAEVLSPATRDNDVGPKRELYARAGVGELWLADPEAATVTPLHWLSGELVAADPVSGDDRLRSSLLSGFALRVDDLFVAR
jgi:Uma2 family endonuclease